MSSLGSVFIDAATPQRCVFALLTLAILLTPALALLARSSGGPWRRLLADLRFAGPLLGLLTAALNSFHMARTVQKLTVDVTARQLAPGVLEVSVLVALGALAGGAAVAALAVSSRQGTSAKIPLP